MEGYDTTPPRVPALSRTWRTHNTDEMDGVVIRAHSHTVTLSRDFVDGPLSAQVDGEAADLADAVYLVQNAYRVEVLTETLAPTPEPGIGKPAACELHRELGRLKFRDHYATASEALGLPVVSLAALTAMQAQTVRSYAYGQWRMPA